MDRYRPGRIIYTDKNCIKTYDGATTRLIAGRSDSHFYGDYREGVGAEARFNAIQGFMQISDVHMVVEDSFNSCLRLIDRESGATSVFSGQCEKEGYQDGLPGLFHYPWCVVMDRNDQSQLLVADLKNSAVRTVDVASGAVGSFVNSSMLQFISHLTQDEMGNMYVSAHHALYKITYDNKVISLLSGSAEDSLSSGIGYRDSTLLNSLYSSPQDIIFIGPDMLLVADDGNKKLRLLDINSNNVTTLNVASPDDYPERPVAILLTENSLFVGVHQTILQYQCE